MRKRRNERIEHSQQQYGVYVDNTDIIILIIMNVAYVAQICTSHECAMLYVCVKQKYFRSVPEIIICWIWLQYDMVKSIYY